MKLALLTLSSVDMGPHAVEKFSFLLLQSGLLCISFCRLLSFHVLFYSPSSLPPTHRLPYPPDTTTLQKKTLLLLLLHPRSVQPLHPLFPSPSTQFPPLFQLQFVLLCLSSRLPPFSYSFYSSSSFPLPFLFHIHTFSCSPPPPALSYHTHSSPSVFYIFLLFILIFLLRMCVCVFFFVLLVGEK